MTEPKAPPPPARPEWDRTLIEALLRMTPAERLVHHTLALRRINRLKAAWKGASGRRV